jgi:hypothetical protein
MPAENVRLPYTTREVVLAPKVPEKPVKSRLSMFPVKETVSVPAVTLKLILFASVFPEPELGSDIARVPTDPE